MRSAETSGVGANGFGADHKDTDSDQGSDKAGSRRPTKSHLGLSPVTTAVAVTALIAATLFVIYDTVRTIDDTQRELAIIGTAFAADIAELAPDAAASAVSALPARFEHVTRASLITTPRSEIVPAFLSRFIPAGPHGTLALEAPQQSIWGTIAQRGAIALCLVGMLTAVAWPRRRGQMPDLLQRHNYRLLASAIPMGVACWTKTGTLVVCNEQYRERLDLDDRTITYHEAVKRMIEGGYMKLLNEDDNNRLIELHRRDGSWLLIDERPLADGGFMTLVSDVTERKKTDTMLHAIREEQRHLARRYHEQKLKAEAASRAKSNFLAHLSHEIRTPLNHIIGFAELMRHQAYGPLGDVRYAEYVQSIKSSGEHLLASFASILDLTELESGHKALRRDPVRVDTLLEQVRADFHGRAARAGIQLSVTAPAGALIEGDQKELARMLGNLVDNAIRFTPSEGQVALAAYLAADGLVIEVTDTGVGMDDERLSSLSQPFALGDANLAREGVGPGLGVSIARSIAELSGGKLVIDSSPSLGTTVAISLPRYANAMEMAA